MSTLPGLVWVWGFKTGLVISAYFPVTLIFFFHQTLQAVLLLGHILNEVPQMLFQGIPWCPASVGERKNLRVKLPALFSQKIEKGWWIFYQDEVGFQTEGTLAATWGIRGQAVEVPTYGRHGRMNMIGAFELGTGLFHGNLTSFRVDATRFRRFIGSLKRRLRASKILLICDNARFHKEK